MIESGRVFKYTAYGIVPAGGEQMEEGHVLGSVSWSGAMLPLLRHHEVEFTTMTPDELASHIRTVNSKLAI